LFLFFRNMFRATEFLVFFLSHLDSISDGR